MKNAEVKTTGPMRRSLCLLTNAYPDFPDSNRVVFIRTLAGLLSRRGWEVSVVAPRVFPGSEPLEREGEVDVRRFPSFLGGRLLVEYSRTPVFRLAGYMAAGVLAAVGCVRRKKCELIHAHWVIPAGLIAIVVGRICGKPVVVTAHGSDILVVPGRSSLVRRVVKFVLERADGVTSVAEHLTDKIVEMGIPREKVLTFPMSVPTESFTSSGPGPEGWSGESVVFSNRSLYPLYDVEALVRAAPAILEEISGAKIVIAGEGPEGKRLLSLADELGVAGHVQLVGAIPHARMPDCLRGAAVYVSTALSDGASVSLLEAMACGAFPVVADIAANREWIEDGKNGFLFPPKDSGALAEKVVESLNRRELRAQAQQINARIVEQRAQWSLNVEKLLALCEKVTIRS